MSRAPFLRVPICRRLIENPCLTADRYICGQVRIASVVATAAEAATMEATASTKATAAAVQATAARSASLNATAVAE